MNRCNAIEHFYGIDENVCRCGKQRRIGLRGNGGKSGGYFERHPVVFGALLMAMFVGSVLVSMVFFRG